MARLLSTLAGAAAVYGGIEAGMEVSHNRRRKRELEGRDDERYTLDKATRTRADEKGQIEHGKFKRETQEEEGARRAALDTAQPAAHASAEPIQLGDAATLPDDSVAASEPGTPARTLAAAPAGEQPVAAPARNDALWWRTANAQAEYWRKQGKPERAQKIMTDSINSAIAERESTYKFDTLPKIEKIRNKGLTAEELKGDLAYTDLQKQAVDKQIETAGLMWGHIVNGNKKAAIDAFNASSIVQPGNQVADIGQSSDGKNVILLDKAGQPARDKDGRPLV